jgi:hypothetical protein
LLLAVILLMGGCSFGAIEDMLSPPRLTAEQSAIYSALTDSMGSGFKLRYPKSGEHRSAFVIYGGAEDAAIVFYEISGINIERSLWVHFLYKDESGWVSAESLPIMGSDIESVSFAAFGDDEEANIIVSYTVGHNEKACMVISNIGRTPFVHLEGIYSFMQADYFFKQAHKELLIIWNDRTVQNPTATFYTRSDGNIIRTAWCELDPSAGEYIDILQGNIEPGIPALFINHRKSDSSDTFGTDVLRFSAGGLINPILENPENTERVIRRADSLTELAAPRDINGDGLIELCYIEGEFPGYSFLPPSERLRPVIWRMMDKGDLLDLYYSYYTERNDFVFMLPARWRGYVTAVVNAEERTVSFLEAEASVHDAEILLLAIRAVPADEPSPPWTRWSYLMSGRENNLRYYIEFGRDSPLMLTDEELTHAFRILSEIGIDYD